ncbi:MAG: ABC transporter permease [Anaerovoracaceae bacterium]|jgi:ABC-2 type transport system permease protein
MRGTYFIGTGKLLKLYLRRDRIILPIWILLPMILIAGQISFVKAMPDWQVFITELSESPLTAAYLGPIVPLNMEGAILWRGMLQASLAVMIGAAFTMIRHTRTEEASGRNELIFGRPVGRYANLTAAMILSCVGSLLAGLLTAAALMSNGFAGSGSLMAGLTLAASGCIFAGIGGLCAQIFEHSGNARGVIFGVYGLTMVAMVLNNMGGGSTGWAWFVPESWFRITVPFGGNYAWPLLVFIVLSAIPMMLSYMLLIRRDMGAGLIAQKEGSANASPRFNSPLALAWRQHKGSILAWAIGMAFLGGIMGVTTPNISEALSSILAQMNEWGIAMAKLGNQEAFIATLIYILGLMAGLSVFAITTVQSLRKEEKEHYVEMILSRPVSRSKWMGSYLAVAFLGSALILLALGLASGLGWRIAAGEFSHLPRVLGMSLSKIPPVWTFIGIAALLYGWLPRIASVINWLILGVFIFIEMLWEVGIVGWSALQWTPFAYAHYSIPINELSIMPLIVLTIIAAALTWLGVIGFKRRSIG